MKIFRDENYKLLCINFTEINEIIFVEDDDKVKESESVSPKVYENIIKKACYIENVSIDFNMLKDVYKGRLVLSPIDVRENPRKFVVFYLRGQYFKIKIESEKGV